MKLFRINYIVVYLFIFSQVYAQLFVENFDYSLGDLTTVSSDWSESPTGSTDIEVISGNLNYSNYPSSGIGKMILLNGGADGRSGISHEFSVIKDNGNSVYLSFLLQLNDTTELDANSGSGEYYYVFKPSGSTSSMRGHLYIRKGSDGETFNLGIDKSSSSTLTWLNHDLNINQTYLIVESYQFQSGNDAVKLWLNPDISSDEPEPDITITAGTDADSISVIQFRQEPLSGNIYIDGIRVSTEWSSAQLPVELVKFTGFKSGNGIRLDWSTATEVNNYGFELEKYKPIVGQALSLPDRQTGLPIKVNHQSNGKGEWQSLVFIPGHGNSNSPKYYRFIDSHPVSGRNIYRLKQIDCNGNYKYSEQVIVIMKPVNKIRLLRSYPNPFNPSTNISFRLTHKSKVRLSLFDTIGKLVTVIGNETYAAGQVSIELDFNLIHSELPSGIYFLNVSGAGYMETLKLIYLK